MSTVYSIRIPKKLRELMNSVNVDWQKEISKYIEDRVRKELIRKYIEEGKKNLAKMKNIDNSDLIRENREA
ncbi:VapB-type antitoxin [Acidianus ambivalens]|uniref:VapB-type antitoxin n=1 Tax=Acidianus ambivalens TaxID=2283 RepID=A0A650CTN4_ACIAM|nr:VapB-type antitoxin [Acidianus ambivalens]MQL56300.1 VapB-type antitoxin [Acidianus ambivalens]QGR21166.1 VapB-type antitoxin [Acidianus ambivalens]